MEEGDGRAMMSGSGPSVLGLFEDYTAAESVYHSLREDGIEAYLCRAVSRV